MRVYWVNKRLAFGSIIKTERDVELLHGLGVTHVINLLKNRNGKKIRRFDSLWLSFRDDKRLRPKWFYKKALKFHKRAFRKRGSKLLVMCYHGRSRSASLTYCILRSSGMTATTAEKRVRAARHNAMLPRAYRDSCERFLGKRGK